MPREASPSRTRQTIDWRCCREWRREALGPPTSINEPGGGPLKREGGRSRSLGPGRQGWREAPTLSVGSFHAQYVLKSTSGQRMDPCAKFRPMTEAGFSLPFINLETSPNSNIDPNPVSLQQNKTKSIRSTWYTNFSRRHQPDPNLDLAVHRQVSCSDLGIDTSPHSTCLQRTIAKTPSIFPAHPWCLQETDRPLSNHSPNRPPCCRNCETYLANFCSRHPINRFPLSLQVGSIRLQARQPLFASWPRLLGL